MATDEECLLPFMLSSNDTSKGKKKRSPAVDSPPSVSNPVLADVVDDDFHDQFHDDDKDLPSNPVSIMLLCL